MNYHLVIFLLQISQTQASGIKHLRMSAPNYLQIGQSRFLTFDGVAKGCVDITQNVALENVLIFKVRFDANLF